MSDVCRLFYIKMEPEGISGLVMDPKTLILALALGSFTFGILLIFQYGKGPSRKIPFWLSAKFLQGTGSLLLYFYDPAPDAPMMHAARCLLLLGCAYEGWAIFHITRHPVSRGLHRWTTFSLISVYFALYFLPLPFLLACHFLLHAIFYALPAYALFHKDGEKSPLRLLTGASFLLLTALFFLHGAALIILPAADHWSFAAAISRLMLPAVFCMMLISGFSLLLLAKENTEQELQRSLREQELQQELLARQKEELLAALEAKNKFLHIVSHEFRTPSGLLLSSADIIDRYWQRMTEEERTKQNNRIRSGVQQINNLINSILAYNHNSAGYEPEHEELDVGEICRTIVGETEIVWNKGHTFQLFIADDCGKALLDRILFRRIIQNLLSNAFRYTDPGGTVSLTVSRRNRLLSIAVSDSGIGIDADDQVSIFDEYFRANNVGTRRGLGLGLTIVQEALQKLEGTIRVESCRGKGTTMFVEIPLTMANR